MNETRPNQASGAVTCLSTLGGTGSDTAICMFGAGEAQTRWSYAELEEIAGHLASGLRKAGLAPGDTAAMLALPCPSWIAVALAVLRAGATVVPIDAQMADAPLVHALNDANPRWLFTDERGARRVSQLALRATPSVLRLDVEQGADSWSSLRDEAIRPPEPCPPDRRAVIFYTSGTTGPPKGVPLTAANLAYQFEVARATGLIMPRDHLLLPLPLHHVYPFVIGLLAPLHVGMCVVIPYALTGPELVRAIRDGEVSVVLGVPRLYRSLVNGIREKAESSGAMTRRFFRAALVASRALRARTGWNAGRVLFGSLHRRLGGKLRIMASGGAPLDPALAADMEALGWEVAIGYGLTETSPLLTVRLPGEGHINSVGRIAPGTEIRIDPSADPGRTGETSRASGNRERGEVLARGPGVFSGYHHLDEATGKAFSGEWFRTGDLGWFDADGFLHLEGRVSTMLVLEGGENIAPETLEDLYAQGEAIAEIGVLQRDGKLVALIVPEASVPRDEADARVKEALHAMREQVPSYQRIARFKLTRHALPRTRLGKIRRHELEERYDTADREEASRRQGPMAIADMPADDRGLLDNLQARKLWELLARRYADLPLEPESRMEADLGMDSMEWVELSIAIDTQLGFSLGREVMEKAETVHDLLEAAAHTSGLQEPDSLDVLRHPESVLREADRRYIEPRPRHLAVIGSLLYVAHEIFMRIMYRMELHGRENLPASGPYVLAPNHVSYLDASALISTLGPHTVKPYFWAGLANVMQCNAVMRLISRIGQVVPIDPRRGPISSLALGAAVLKRGHPMVWFPEGGRSPDGTLQPFRPGIGLILHEYPDIPVLPVFLTGTYEAYPMNRRWPKPGRITVRIGAPQHAGDLEKMGDGDTPHHRIASGLHDAVARLGKEELSS